MAGSALAPAIPAGAQVEQAQRRRQRFVGRCQNGAVLQDNEESRPDEKADDPSPDDVEHVMDLEADPGEADKNNPEQE